MTNEKEVNEMNLLTTPSFPKWWRGLPSLLMMMVISNIDILILNDFVEYRYAKYYGTNSTSSETAREICLNDSRSSPSLLSTTTPKHPISTTTSLPDVVQSSTARLNVYIYLAVTSTCNDNINVIRF